MFYIKKIGAMILLLLVISLIGCNHNTTITPPVTQPSTIPPVEVMWYQNIQLSANKSWSSSVVETDLCFYYIAEDGVYEYTKELGTIVKIIPEIALGLFLYDGHLYYNTEYAVKSINLHTKNISALWDDTMLPTRENTDKLFYTSINDFALWDGYLYIAGTSTSVIRIDLESYTTEMFLNDCRSMVLLGNNCYYLDHAERTFSLYHMICNTKEITLLRGEGDSYPEEMLIDGIAGIQNTILYSVRDGADIYLYNPDGSDEKIFDGDNSEYIWLTLVNQWSANGLYFYTTDGLQLKLYEYRPETGVSLLASFEWADRLCNIAITASAVFWLSEDESAMKCMVKEQLQHY